jgi:hypothetical protein
MAERITDRLKRITREQGGAGEAASAPESAGSGGAKGRFGPLLVVLIVAVLAGGGWWLIRTMQADSKLQDCVMSGRKNCVEGTP